METFPELRITNYVLLQVLLKLKSLFVFFFNTGPNWDNDFVHLSLIYHINDLWFSPFIEEGNEKCCKKRKK